MLKAKDKYDYRHDLAKELRSGRWTQHVGPVVTGLDRAGGQACLFQVFAMMVAGTDSDMYNLAEQKLGITHKEVEWAFSRNDEGFNFEYLANWLENLP